MPTNLAAHVSTSTTGMVLRGHLLSHSHSQIQPLIFIHKIRYLLRPSSKVEYCDQSPVCFSDRTRTSGITRQNFNKFSVHVIYGHTWLSPPLAAL